MAVTLPAVLLILDFYPFKRLGYNQTNVRTVIFEKMPFFLISLIVSAINIYTQQLGGALRTIESYPLIDRLFFAAIAPLIYLLKVIFPFNLIPYYPSQIINSGLLMFISSLFLLILITLIAIRLSKRNRLFLAIWCYYIITLFPVIGLIKVGGHAMADRYMYLPSLGPFILVGLIAGLVLEKKYIRIRYKILPIVLLLVSIFAGTTVMQIRLWRDSITLWSHVINYYPNSIYPCGSQ